MTCPICHHLTTHVSGSQFQCRNPKCARTGRLYSAVPTFTKPGGGHTGTWTPAKPGDEMPAKITVK